MVSPVTFDALLQHMFVEEIIHAINLTFIIFKADETEKLVIDFISYFLMLFQVKHEKLSALIAVELV